MRVAIYSRFSSDLQDIRSLTDQAAAARTHADRQGWTVVAEYADAAISGSALHNRPGLLDLMVAAQARRFDVVLTESLDRLSRDLEDIAGLHKRLAYWGVRIVTLADGEVGKLHVGLKGMIASIYLDDLAQKTRRGQVGRVKAGRIPGGRCYGYDVVADGEDRGRRRIDEAEAAIVRRIFAEYVAGASPLAIAGRLNAEGVPAPRGGAWNASTLNGSRKRANGVLSNSLYAGLITYNRQRFVTDPATGRRQARLNPREQWIEQAVPELAIVASDVFEAAQRRRAALGGQALRQRRRARHLLSGLVGCGACGANMIVVRNDRLGCSAHANRATCGNGRTITTREIESRVLSALQAHLLAPDLVAAAVEAYREERDRLAKAGAARRRQSERDLSGVDRKIAGVVAAIEAGGDPRMLAQRLNDLERERREVLARVPAGPAAAVAIHPQAADRYRAKVAEIHAALVGGPGASGEAMALVRELIQRVVVHPTPGRETMQIELVGDLAALMAERPENLGAISMVAGAGFEPATFRL